MRLIAVCTRLRLKAQRLHKHTHAAEHGVHIVYGSAVFLEGHGVYATAGGLLAVVVLVNWLIGSPEEG